MAPVAVRMIKCVLYYNPGEGRRGSGETEGRGKGLDRCGVYSTDSMNS